MFYDYLRLFNWFSGIFGVAKPFPSFSCKLKTKTKRWRNLWSLIVALTFVSTYFYPNNFWSDIRFKTHLDEIASGNNLIVNVLIIFINILCNGENNYSQLYATIISVLRELRVLDENQKLFALKLYAWMMIPFTIFIILIVLEFVYANPPYTLIVKMPIFFSILHLVIHLSLMSAALEVINLRIFEKFEHYNNFFLQDFPKPKRKLNYFFNPSIKFFNVDIKKYRVDLKLLCKIHDDIGVSMILLQNIHGTQLLLSVWLMFSNAVTGITLITHERANVAWVVTVRSALPFLWFLTGCYVDGQIRQEVERTDLLIIKHLTDFRCDKQTREILQTFRQVVAANRLEFTACNLFRLNYATILGTIVNVITYSIILIQIL